MMNSTGSLMTGFLLDVAGSVALYDMHAALDLWVKANPAAGLGKFVNGEFYPGMGSMRQDLMEKVVTLGDTEKIIGVGASGLSLLRPRKSQCSFVALGSAEHEASSNRSPASPARAKSASTTSSAAAICRRSCNARGYLNSKTELTPSSSAANFAASAVRAAKQVQWQAWIFCGAAFSKYERTGRISSSEPLRRWKPPMTSAIFSRPVARFACSTMLHIPECEQPVIITSPSAPS